MAAAHSALTPYACASTACVEPDIFMSCVCVGGGCWRAPKLLHLALHKRILSAVSKDGVSNSLTRYACVGGEHVHHRLCGLGPGL